MKFDKETVEPTEDHFGFKVIILCIVFFVLMLLSMYVYNLKDSSFYMFASLAVFFVVAFIVKFIMMDR